MASSEPLPMTDLEARESRTVLARVDLLIEQQRAMLDGLERMIEMLDGFATRAEPLLQRVEKRATIGALFTGGK